MANLKRVYPHSFETARENGELELYHKNTQLNRNCAKAIDTAVSESMYEPYHYNLDGAVQKVCDEYGTKRVAWVLAVNTHPAILDVVAEKVRNLPVKQRKPSIAGQLQKSEKAEQSNESKPKKNAPEREDAV